jgi:hypothetical protein
VRIEVPEPLYLLSVLAVKDFLIEIEAIAVIENGV